MQTAQEVINALGAISKARYLAMDENNEWFIYTKKPYIPEKQLTITGSWNSSNVIMCELSKHIFNIQPAENWRESLVEYQPNPEIKIQEYGKKI